MEKKIIQEEVKWTKNNATLTITVNPNGFDVVDSRRKRPENGCVLETNHPYLRQAPAGTVAILKGSMISIPLSQERYQELSEVQNRVKAKDAEENMAYYAVEDLLLTLRDKAIIAQDRARNWQDNPSGDDNDAGNVWQQEKEAQQALQEAIKQHPGIWAEIKKRYYPGWYPDADDIEA